MPAPLIAATCSSRIILPAGTITLPSRSVIGFRGRAAEDARDERGHDRARIDDGAHLDAALRAALLHGDDGVLRDVDEAAREVTRVRRLQRGVGQTLAGAVRGVEILQNRQAFLEVGDDRALDDLARGLGHQAAHGGKLAHLRRRAARARMRHHVDRVHRLVAAVLVLAHGGDALHHLFGELVRALRPGVDDLVVLLALGDQAVVVLLLIFLGERGGVGDALAAWCPARPCRPCRTRCRP